jgi:uncharacterized iron-regulated membrane protein
MTTPIPQDLLGLAAGAVMCLLLWGVLWILIAIHALYRWRDRAVAKALASKPRGYETIDWTA